MIKYINNIAGILILLNIFDQIIVAVSDGNTKNSLFDASEREHLIKKALFNDLKFNKKKIIVTSFKTLTTDFCKKMKKSGKKYFL